MVEASRLKAGTWLLTFIVISLALYVWWPSVQHLTAYSFFPLLGLVAFSLMWVHYIAGAVRRFLDLPELVLRSHFRITSYVVLGCILAHPSILYTKLYLDGLGLPYHSVFSVYTVLISRLAIVAGTTALIIFLSFETYRFFKEKPWWRYVEWANIGAMLFVLWHGFTLGRDLRHPWFQVIWLIYAVSFIGAVTYSEIKKRSHDQYATV